MSVPADSSERPWVTVLSPTLTGNAVLRTYTIVRLLSTSFRVQIIGFDPSNDLYHALAGTDFSPSERFHSSHLFGWIRRTRSMAPRIKGEALVCVKPLLGSFGTGLLLARRLRRPLVVDIDDWEPGFLSSSPYWEFRAHGPGWFYRTGSPLMTRVLDGFVYRADAVTVSNSFLQALYGGHWIPHFRDASQFQPMPPRNPTATRSVLFCGSPRAHKGLDLLCRAWLRLGRTDAVLHLAVPDPSDRAVRSLPGADSASVKISGPYPFTEIPQLLADASVVVVPQDNARGAVGQLPVKLLDAMAMAKPIVTTDVCDGGRWLQGGAGIVVTPGSEDALVEGLARALEHPETWDAMGRLARARFLQFGSEAILSTRLCSVVSAVIHRTAYAARPAFESSPGQ